MKLHSITYISLIRTFTVFIGIAVGFLNSANALYLETFDTANKGIWIDPCITNDPTSCTSFDLSSIDLTIEGKLYGLVNAYVLLQDPELDIRNEADNADILNNSTIISSALGTDFGSVCVAGGSSSNTYRAENNGVATLTFGPDALSISNTTDFSITTDLINNGSVSDGGVETFSIQFDPASSGIKTCTVTISSDDPDEDPYTFEIQGEGINSDVTVSVSPTSVFEDGVDNLVFTFTRNCTIGALTVDFDVAGSLNSFNDYTTSGATSFNFFGGTVDFADGQAIALVTVDPSIDNIPEQDEDITLTVEPGAGYSVGSPSSATGTVQDDDAATISITDVTMNEGDAGTIDFCFIISPTILPEEEVLMTATTADDSAEEATNGIGSDDYEFKTETVSINSDFPNPQFCVTVNSDEVTELHETFFVNLTGLITNGQNVTFADDQGLGTILNDDQSVITLAGPYSEFEGNSGATAIPFGFTMSNPVDIFIALSLTPIDGTATYADPDFFATGFGVDAGLFGFIANNAPIILGDTKLEPDESFTLEVSESTFGGRDVVFTGGATSETTTVEIKNDDFDWGDAPNSYPTLNNSGGPSHAGSNLWLGSTNDGEPDGIPTADATGDGAEDDGVTFTSALQAGLNASVDVQSTGSGLLDAWIDFSGNGMFESGEQIFTSEPLAAGVNNLNFLVPGSAVGGNTIARFRLSSAGGLAHTGPALDGEVEDYQVFIATTEFSIDDPTVVEGDAGTTNLTFTITRSENTNSNSVNYSITSGTATSGDDYQVFAAGMANFAAGGNLSQTISVTVNGDKIVELDETIEMTLDTPVNGVISKGIGIGTIENDDAAVITLNSPDVQEGDAGTTDLIFTASLDNSVDVTVNFTYSTSDGTATIADNDYQAAVVASFINSGNLTRDLAILVNGDCQIEPDELLNLTLGSLSASGREVSFAGAQPTLSTTGNINNDDAIPTISAPTDFDQNTDLGQCSAVVTIPFPTTTVCGNEVLDFRHRQVDQNNTPISAWSSWIPSSNNTLTLTVGRYEVEWQVTDGSGTATDNFYIEVIDNEDPTVSCMPATVFLDTDGNAGITFLDVYAGANDNCSKIDFSVSPDMFTCAELGENTVVLTAIDDNGNTASCNAIVTVIDNILPIALCNDISIDIGTTGSTNISPSQVDGGSSDNCDIDLSLDNDYFTCSEEGPNNIVLTVTDGQGNSEDCNAIVTVNPFLIITSCTVTPVSCAGAGDGSIQITATAPAGQIGYSVDNGDNFKFVGTFNNLTPGDYNILVKVFGIPGVCEVLDLKTVDPGPQPITCYQDNDGDGYTPGTTITSCTCPTGFVASAIPGDCNDFNSDIHPDATELCDGLDNDCDDIIPSDELDSDGDGFRVCENDCNDNDQSVNPGALEICNGIDDDCNGIIDDNVSGSTVYAGSATLTSQSDLDTWLPCYTEIDGNLFISGYDISDLSNLSNITNVTGSVTIYFNGSLTTLNGLENLNSVGANLNMYYNFSLSDCCAIYDLLDNGGVVGGVLIFFNAAGCNSQSDILNGCAPAPFNNGDHNNEIGWGQNGLLNINLIPNPASEMINVRYNRTIEYSQIRVLDTFGRVVFEKKLDQMAIGTNIDITNLANGVYLLLLIEKGKTSTKQFIVQH